MLKYILFDLDGTLTESAPGIMNSLKYAFKKLGGPVPDDAVLKKFVGPPLIESFMKFSGFSEEKATMAVDVYREYFAEKGLFENSVYEGIPDCLKRLREAGYTLGVATSKPQVFCERILDHFGLTEYFGVIKGIPLDGEDMTKAEVISEALGALGAVDRSEAVMIGDRAYDAVGAEENGVGCIGVLYGYGTEEELLGAGAETTVKTPRELADLLLGMR